MRRSSSEWQVSSGKDETALGLGPRSPTISSPSPMYMAFLSQRLRKFIARSTGVDTRPSHSL